MKLFADMHVHSKFSIDGTSTMEEYCLTAEKTGSRIICFTEHVDFNSMEKNLSTIKDLIRKDLGVSVLPKSSCVKELSKGKLVALPIENLSMVRETRIVYGKDFAHKEILQTITKVYHETVKAFR